MVEIIIMTVRALNKLVSQESILHLQAFDLLSLSLHILQ